ncbi:MAG: hypothetical protein ACRDO7_03700 [Nocardioidaceae bacterium]
MSADTRADPRTVEPAVSPPVKRLRRPPWSDPRLLVGLIIVAGSVVAGSRLLASADDTVAVWSVRADHRAGTPVVPDDLHSMEVRLDQSADSYVPADQPIEPGLVWARDVHSGELLGVAATRPADAGEVGELPVTVAAGALPSDLAEGDRVDVWVSDDVDAASSRPARLVLEQMRVLSVAGAPAAMGDTSGYRVLLALEEDAPSRLGEALGAITGGQVTLVRKAAPETP